MDKRIVFTIAAVAGVGSVIWLTTRSGESGAVAEQASSVSAPATVTPESMPDVAPAIGDAGTTEGPPNARADAPVSMQGEAASPSRSMGEALPIDVSPGFEFLSKPAAEMEDTDSQWGNWRRHQKLQSEPRDESWAPRMEAALRSGIQDSLMARGLDTQRIELPVIECRTSGCEIQAVGFSQDNMKPGDFQTILFSLLGGSLGSEFDQNGFNLTMSPRSDQRITFLAQLARKKN
jgi:hypothetical protein